MTDREKVIKRKDCPMLHENGNCLSMGGFCTAVNYEICKGLMNAYNQGWSDRSCIYWEQRKEETQDG